MSYLEQFSFNPQQWGEIGLVILTIGELAVLMGGIFWVFWYLRPMLFWQYRILVFGYRNGVRKYLGTDFAQVQKHDGVLKLRIWKAKRFVEPPANEFVIAHSAKKDVIPFFVGNDGNYYPISLAPSGRSMNPNDKDVDFWFVQEVNRAMEEYREKNKLHEWLPFIATTTFMLFIFVFMLILNHQMGKLVDQLGNLVSALTSVL